MARDYTLEFKASALTIYDANGGRSEDAKERASAMTKTAKHLGIPRNTLKRWTDRADRIKNALISTETDDTIARLRQEKTGVLTDELRETAFVLLSMGDALLAQLHAKMPDMNPVELVQTLRAVSAYAGVTMDRLARLEATGAGAGHKLDDSAPGVDGFFRRAFGKKENASA